MSNGVTIYEKPFAAELLTQLLDEHQDLFVDQGQTVEIALRFHLIANPEADFNEILSYIQSTINNFSSSVTDITLNKLYYGFRVNDVITMLLADPSDLSKKVFRKLRLIKKEKADNVIIFTSIIMKARYDSKHLNVNLKEGDEVFLRLHNEYFIFDLSNRKLSQQRMSPFKILAKVNRLTYRLQLSSVIKIHLVISVAQLEPSTAIVTDSDPYKRSINIESPSMFNERDEVKKDEFKRIKNRRLERNKKSKYLIK